MRGWSSLVHFLENITSCACLDGSALTGVNSYFKPLILSVFTIVASWLKSEQKEKEK